MLLDALLHTDDARNPHTEFTPVILASKLLTCCRDGVRKMDIRIKVAWVLNATSYIAAICMVAFKCWPLHRQWQINPDPGSK